jgi:hypothetical protein
MFNPFPVAAWWRTAFKAMEISLAAPQVIVYRTARMLQRSADAQGRKEVLLMGQEKVEASGESWLAMAVQLQKINAELAADAFRHTLGAWSALASFATASTVQQVANAQKALLRSMIVAKNRNLPAAYAKLLADGLHPVHKRATSNARRLSRRKQK